jgi:hypothetical protein
VIICLFFSLIGTVQADEEAVKRYRNYTPEQIKALPEKERQSSLPMMYIFAAQKGLSPAAKLTFQMELNSLMYPAVSDYEKAVKLFQSDLSENPSGVLTVGQISDLTKRSEIQKLNTVVFPHNLSSYITDDMAHVEGTDTLLDERIAWPINHVKITCYKTGKYCEYKQIALNVPTDKEFSYTYSISDFAPDIYEITRWGNGVIDAVSANKGACREVSLNLNFKTKEFFETTRNTDKPCEILNVKFPKLEKPRLSQVVNGEKIFETEFGKIREKAFSYLSSDFRKQVEAFTNEHNKSK